VDDELVRWMKMVVGAERKEVLYVSVSESTRQQRLSPCLLFACLMCHDVVNVQQRSSRATSWSRRRPGAVKHCQ
jgi:hypothetical protein